MGGRDCFEVRLNIGGGGIRNYVVCNIIREKLAHGYTHLLRIQIGSDSQGNPDFYSFRRNDNPNQIEIHRIASPMNL